MVSEVAGKQKADDIIEQESLFQLLQAAGLGSFIHVALALESIAERVIGTIDSGWLELRNKL